MTLTESVKNVQMKLSINDYTICPAKLNRSIILGLTAFLCKFYIIDFWKIQEAKRSINSVLFALSDTHDGSF